MKRIDTEERDHCPGFLSKENHLWHSFSILKRKLSFMLEQHFPRDSGHQSVFTIYLSLMGWILPSKGTWDLVTWHALGVLGVLLLLL